MNAKQTIIEIEGMTCPSCVRHVEAALRELAGIRALNVSLEKGNVVVEHDDGSPPIEAMIDALGEAGYESRAVAA